MHSPRLVLYGRPDCHLCDEARGALVALRQQGYRFQLREIDIETDAALMRSYLERIPVLSVDGEVVSELVLDERALRARLDRVAG